MVSVKECIVHMTVSKHNPDPYKAVSNCSPGLWQVISSLVPLLAVIACQQRQPAVSLHIALVLNQDHTLGFWGQLEEGSPASSVLYLQLSCMVAKISASLAAVLL